MKKIVSSLVALGTALSALTMPLSTIADSMSVDFETYALGNINGQDSWTSLGAAGSGCALYDHKVDSSLATTGFGNQSLRISNAVTSGCFGDQTFAKPLVNAAGEADSTNGSFSAGILQSHYEAQFDIASTMATEQTGLFVSVSPDRGDGSRMSYLGFGDEAGGIRVTFYEVTGNTSPVNFVPTDLGLLDRTNKHTAKFVIDFVDGPSNDIVKIYLDGVLVKTGTTWENYYRFDTEASAEQTPRITKTLLFRTGGAAVPANAGKGYLFDNLSLTSGLVDTISPIVTNVVSPSPVVAGAMTTVTANVDDSTTGGSNIASAHYSVDGGTTWTPMSAVDGSYDESSEDVTASFAFSSAGAKEICVKGADVAGNSSDGTDCTTVLVIDPFTGFVSGGGNLKSGKKVTTTFGGNVGSVPGVGLVGNFQVVYHTTKVACHYHTINSLLISGDTAVFNATAKCNNGDTPTKTFTLQDKGEPGSSDMFGDSVIAGGNIQIHEVEGVLEFTLYADGSTSCPGADDLTHPAGTVQALPVPGGVFFKYNFDGVAANTLYNIAVSKEPNCASPTFYNAAVTTDSNGDGTFTGFYASGSGLQNLLFNSGSTAAGINREVSTTDAVILVP